MTPGDARIPQRPSILGILQGFIPSTLIDVVQPMVDLDRAGAARFRVTLESLFVPKDLEQVDLVVLCRNAEPKGILEAVRRRGIPYIFDMDDNLFEVPADTAPGRYYRDPARQAALAAYIRHAALVRVYSEPVLQRCLALNPRVEKVVAPVNWQQIRPPARPAGPGPVRIVFATSRVEDDLSRIFLPALDRLAVTHAGRFSMTFWGSIPPGYQGRPGFHYLPPVQGYNRFLRQFSRMGFDIGLAPLPDDEFHRSKTNNKFREYGASRAAGVYSDVEVYNTCVEHGRTGLLAPNDPDAWYEALRQLIEDAELRQSIQENAYRFAREHYHQDRFNALWREHIRQALATGTVKTGLVEPAAVEPAAVDIPPPGQAAVLRDGEINGTPARRAGKITEKLARVLREGLGGAVQFARWVVFPTWMLFKINWLKRV